MSFPATHLELDDFLLSGFWFVVATARQTELNYTHGMTSNLGGNILMKLFYYFLFLLLAL